MKNTLISLLIPFICFGQRIDLQPKVAKGRIVEHTYFHLSYVEEHEQSEWVHYRLDSIMLKGKEMRKDYNFRVDTKDSITSSSTNYNYKKCETAAQFRTTRCPGADFLWAGIILAKCPTTGFRRWVGEVRRVSCWSVAKQK